MSEQPKRPVYKTVLVIDDNEVDRYIANRNIMRYCLAEKVILKESAPQALAYLQSLQDTPDELPQLIFLDIRMPEMDGFEFLAQYEKLPDAVKSNCIVMMLSTSLSENDHDKVRANKFISRFLSKPLDKERIDEMLGGG